MPTNGNDPKINGNMIPKKNEPNSPSVAGLRHTAPGQNLNNNGQRPANQHGNNNPKNNISNNNNKNQAQFQNGRNLSNQANGNLSNTPYDQLVKQNNNPQGQQQNKISNQFANNHNKQNSHNVVKPTDDENQTHQSSKGLTASNNNNKIQSQQNSVQVNRNNNEGAAKNQQQRNSFNNNQQKSAANNSQNFNSDHGKKNIAQSNNSNKNVIGNFNKQNSQNGLISSSSHRESSSSQQQSQQQGLATEKKFTGRCRLFVGNLPIDIGEQDFKELFQKYGEIGECFLNSQKNFGFIKLDTRVNAELAKHELDGFIWKGRAIRVRFASHGAAVRVKNLSSFVSNEYLEQAFSIFGPVERAVVIVDEKGRSTGEGIVEFERKPGAMQCINRCTDNCFILTAYPKPVVVEPLDQKDEEDGLAEKSLVKNAQYHEERDEASPHFAPANSLELEIALKWRELYELEKQIQEEGRKRVEQAREMLEFEIEQRLIDFKTQKIKEDLRMKQEELIRIEEQMRKSEFQRRKDMEMRQFDDMNKFSRSNGLQQPGLLNQSNQQVSQQTTPHLENQSNRSNRPGNQSDQSYQSGRSQKPSEKQNQQPPVNQIAGGNILYQNTTNQQQAMLAAQLSAFAMAAAAHGNLGLPLFEQPPALCPPHNAQMEMNHKNENRGRNVNNNNNNKGNGDRRDYYSSNNARRGANSRRDDQSPFPGYDSKRARF